jgi:hypothetical protein
MFTDDCPFFPEEKNYPRLPMARFTAQGRKVMAASEVRPGTMGNELL